MYFNSGFVIDHRRTRLGHIQQLRPFPSTSALPAGLQHLALRRLCVEGATGLGATARPHQPPKHQCLRTGTARRQNPGFAACQSAVWSAQPGAATAPGEPSVSVLCWHRATELAPPTNQPAKSLWHNPRQAAANALARALAWAMAALRLAKPRADGPGNRFLSQQPHKFVTKRIRAGRVRIAPIPKACSTRVLPRVGNGRFDLLS